MSPLGLEQGYKENLLWLPQLSHWLVKILQCSVRQSLPHITYSLRIQQRGDGVLHWDSDFLMVTVV